MIEVGDTVITKKGCRIKGAPGKLKVITTDKYWGYYPACICEKEDGTKRLFLLKNLTKENEEVQE